MDNAIRKSLIFIIRIKIAILDHEIRVISWEGHEERLIGAIDSLLDVIIIKTGDLNQILTKMIHMFPDFAR